MFCFFKNLLYANINNFLQSIFTEKETSPSPVSYMGIVPPSSLLGGKGEKTTFTSVGRRVTGSLTIGQIGNPQVPLKPKLGISLRAKLPRPHLGGESKSTPL